MREQNGWFYSILATVRDNIAEGAEVIAAAATVLAAFFIVAKMVRFHYQLSSDSEGGGLGDVKAWDFIKPIFLLLLIGMSPQIAQGINSVVNICMTALDTGAEGHHYKAMYIAELSTKADQLAAYSDENLIATGIVSSKDNLAKAREYAKQRLSPQQPVPQQGDEAQSASALTLSRGTYNYGTAAAAPVDMSAIDKNIQYNNLQKEMIRARNAKGTDLMKEGKITTQDAMSKMKEVAYADDVEFSLSNVLEALGAWIWNTFIDALLWIYRMIILIRLFMGTAFMSVMLYFFPLVFLAMLFDRYKGAFGSFIVTYVELALWQPIASILLYISSEVMSKMMTGSSIADSGYVLMVIIATIFAAGEIGTYAKYAMTAFNGSGGNGTGKSGLGGLKSLIK